MKVNAAKLMLQNNLYYIMHVRLIWPFINIFLKMDLNRE